MSAPIEFVATVERLPSEIEVQDFAPDEVHVYLRVRVRMGAGQALETMILGDAVAVCSSIEEANAIARAGAEKLGPDTILLLAKPR